MFDQLNSKTKSNDEFIENKIKFIQSFIKQRKLRVYFEKIIITFFRKSTLIEQQKYTKN